MLLAQAEDWLKHGRKYIDFAEPDRGKSWVVWRKGLLLVLLVSPALAIWFTRKQRQTKTQSES